MQDMHDFGALEFELVAEGLKFPEGPVALPSGEVLVVEIEGDTVARIGPDGSIHRFKVGRGPNGMALGPDGGAYVCCDGGLHFSTTPDGIRYPDNLGDGYVGGEIQRLDLETGEVRTVFTHVGEDHIMSLNDIVFDHTGHCYVVDTAMGRIYYADPVAGSIGVAEQDLAAPNGMGLSPDGATLFVSETFSGRIYRWDVAAPGRLANKRRIYPGEGEQADGPVGFDGLSIDAQGAVCVANLAGSGITVVAPDGRKLGVATVPLQDTFVTNICFGGPDLRTAWICSSGRGRLYRTRWPVAGLDLHFSGFGRR
jgi:gluconolactonase